MKLFFGILTVFLFVGVSSRIPGHWLIMTFSLLPMVTIQQIKRRDKKREQKDKFNKDGSSTLAQITVLPTKKDSSPKQGNEKEEQAYFIPLINLQSRKFSTGMIIQKRVLDIVLSVTILILLAPVLLAIAILIKLDSRGPVFYKQKRVGERGNLFYLYKFRSMIENAELNTGPVWARENDSRITRVGRILRKSHLDELPQLFNVLMGEMSLVGPRPERPFFVEKLAFQIPNYCQRLQIRPGITGWAQINYKYDSTIEDVKRKLDFDLSYIENMNALLDLKIVFLTGIKLLSPKFLSKH